MKATKKRVTIHGKNYWFYADGGTHRILMNYNERILLFFPRDHSFP